MNEFPDKKTFLDQMFDEEYPEPTMIVIDKDTDMSRIHETASVAIGQPRRQLVGIKTFKGEEEFLAWQKESPREIFEITPKVVAIGERISTRIFVTYNAGVTNGT